MPFPQHRLRRLRRTGPIRSMVRETALDAADLILPLFVCPGKKTRKPIRSMPGCFQLSVDEIVREAREAHELGIPAVLLFGIPERKDDRGSEGHSAKGVVQNAVRALRKALPDLVLITDVCLCEYTSHGHCGLIVDGDVANDPTLDLLARQALSHVEAGADIVAPSDMMDGRVGAIRRALDSKGFEQIPILSYAAKFCSGLYGPFRDAAESAPRFGDRRSYQLDPPNAREALKEVELDLEEGADIVMVKPALPYLDIVRQIRDRFSVPVAAYNVSGEYAMVKAAVEKGWLDERRVVLEILTSIKRAGADLIFTYHAREAARWLREEKGR